MNSTQKKNNKKNITINDDKKILGIRTVQHPYQIAHSPNGRDIYFGTLFYNKPISDNIYYTTGVRL